MKRDERAFWSLAQEKLSRGESVRYRARGQSMWPMIPDGSTLTLRPLALERIRRGDVVLSLGADHAAAHRVLRKPRSGTVMLRGDRHSESETVSTASLVARVDRIEYRWLSYPPGHPVARRIGILVSIVGARWSAWRASVPPCAPCSPSDSGLKPNR